MGAILKLVSAMFLFLSLFLAARNVDGKQILCPSIFLVYFLLLCSSFFLILTTFCLFSFSLQHFLDVLLTQIVKSFGVVMIVVWYVLILSADVCICTSKRCMQYPFLQNIHKLWLMYSKKMIIKWNKVVKNII